MADRNTLIDHTTGVFVVLQLIPNLLVWLPHIHAQKTVLAHEPVVMLVLYHVILDRARHVKLLFNNLASVDMRFYHSGALWPPARLDTILQAISPVGERAERSSDVGTILVKILAMTAPASLVP